MAEPTKYSGSDLEMPTIQRLLVKCALFRTDRAVLVRNPKPDRLTALAVILIGERALKEVGLMVTEFCIAKGVHYGGGDFNISPSDSLPPVFDRMEKQRCQFYALGLDYPGIRAGAMLLVGDELCRDLAPKLTELRAPTQIEEVG
ncbi:MAG: hypothetical protein JWL59_3542 [Chthoniobacteraceae bacterium]|nr:hypothetical protein [Chthoniobacteraceae bacterium]